jgi:IPT/TIG domain/Fibronectin type III domain/Galactose oxidase, central domain/Kelch motif
MGTLRVSLSRRVVTKSGPLATRYLIVLIGLACALVPAAKGQANTGNWATTGNLNTAREYHSATATRLSDGSVLFAGGYNGGYVQSAEIYHPEIATFTTTASLNTPRYSHSATLLTNGMVLIIGGYGSTGYLSSAELYNPATGRFTATGNLNTARAYHTATRLYNGMVLITGGSGNSGYLASAELYNPAAGTFTITGSLVTARQYQAAVLLMSGNVLVTGGYGASGNLASSELYYPTAGTFSATGSLATARQHHTITILNGGTVLVTGGNGNSGYLSSVELYNPSTGTFSNTGSLIAARQYHSAMLQNDGMVLIAGGGNSLGYLATSELYNPATGTFSSTGNLNSARQSHSATLLNDGRTLIAGGNNGAYLSSAEIFSPASGVFLVTGSLSTARSGSAANVLSDGSVLVSGGYNGSALSITELYNPSIGTFTSTGSLVIARYGHISTILGNGLVLVAGGSGLGCFALASAEVYDPVSRSFSTTGIMVAHRRVHTSTLLNNGKVLIVGGYGSTSSCTGGALLSAELYDPSTRTFSATGGLHSARWGHRASLLTNGKVLITGGTNGSSYLSSAELYDPSTGTFAITGSMSAARVYHGAALLGSGKVLVAGGSNGTDLSSAELYDPTTGTFGATGSMLSARNSHLLVTLNNGSVLVTGGLFGTSYLASAELYKASSGTFSSAGSMHSVRIGHTSTLLNDGNVLIEGGASGSSAYLASAELYEVNAVVPQITSLAPISGAIGSSVTITGQLFGPPQPNSSVLFNGVAAAITSWSATSIIVTVPIGATTGNVVVSVGGIPSNGVSFTPGPSITSLSSASGAVGNQIKIEGVNFGLSGTVTFNGKTATTSNWTTSSVLATVPTGATTGPIVLTAGGFASNGVAFTITSSGGTPPAAPTNLSATTISNTQINLSWTASVTPGVTYTILRNSVPAATGRTTTSYSDIGLTAGTTYHYQVEAVNSSGTSAPSNTANGLTSGGTPPQPPSNLFASTLSANDIELNWNASLSFGVTYTVTATPPGVPIATNVTGVSYIYSSASPNTQYCFTVVAVNSSGSSASSNQSCAMTFAASCPKVEDQSSINSGPDENGNVNWELKALVTDQNGSKTYDIGSIEAFGIHTLPYFDCLGEPNPGIYQQGNVHLNLNIPQLSGQAGFIWYADVWFVDIEPCIGGCDGPDGECPNPDGVEEIAFPLEYPTPFIYRDCP